MATDGLDDRLPPPPARGARVYLFHLRQHGQAEGSDAFARRRSAGWWPAPSPVSGLTPRRRVPAGDVGLAYCAFLALVCRAGGRGACRDRAIVRPDELLPLLRDARPSLLCMLPAPLFAVVRDHGATRDDFASVRRCVSGRRQDLGGIGARISRRSPGIRDRRTVWHDRNRARRRINPTAAGNRIGSIGQLAPGFAASIRDDDRRGSAHAERPGGCGSSRPAT